MLLVRSRTAPSSHDRSITSLVIFLVFLHQPYLCYYFFLGSHTFVLTWSRRSATSTWLGGSNHNMLFFIFVILFHFDCQNWRWFCLAFFFFFFCSTFRYNSADGKSFDIEYRTIKWYRQTRVYRSRPRETSRSRVTTLSNRDFVSIRKPTFSLNTFRHHTRFLNQLNNEESIRYKLRMYIPKLQTMMVWLCFFRYSMPILFNIKICAVLSRF